TEMMGLETDDFAAMAQAFTRSTWFDFYDEEEQRHRCRLTWISPKRSRFLFTNQEGFDAFVRTEREVVELLRQGRLRVLGREALVDRALHRIMGSADAAQPA
ncbi:MAG: DUF1631 family protein, partial [Betaproteobacteria bacterium]